MQHPHKVPVLFDREFYGYNKEQVDSYVSNLSRAYGEVFDALAKFASNEDEKKLNNRAPTETKTDLQKAIEDFYAEALGPKKSWPNNAIQ